MKVFIVLILYLLLFSTKKVVFSLDVSTEEIKDNTSTTTSIFVTTQSVENITEVPGSTTNTPNTNIHLRSSVSEDDYQESTTSTVISMPVLTTIIPKTHLDSRISLSEDDNQESTTSTVISKPDPPTLFYNNYIIHYSDNSDDNEDLSIIEKNLICPDNNISISTVEKYINTNNETLGFEKGVVYNCTATVSTDYATSDESLPLLVPPGTREISSINYEEGNITWTAPFENVSLTYKLVIDSWTPNHFIPQRCDFPENFDVTTNETSYYLDITAADYNFNVTISTEFWSILVEKSAKLYIPPKNPGIPENISVQDIEDNDADISYILYWNTPCDSNGNIIGYNVSLITDGSNVLNETIANDTNEYKLPPLLSNKDYVVVLITLGDDQRKSDEAFYNFSTKQGKPPAPTFDEIIPGATYFTILWQDSDEHITTYTLDIIPTGPDYNQLNGNCPSPEPETIELLGTDTKYNFTNAWSKYNYNISLVASTSAGSGPAAITSVTTKSSVPEAPENVTIDVNDSTNNITGILRWDAPCKMNGVIKAYIINILECYTEDSTDVEIKTITSDEASIDLYLKPSHSYVFNISAELEDGVIGLTESYNYTSRDGIPGLPQNIETETTDSTYLIIRWQAPVEKVGSIENYYLNITSTEPLYDIPPECQNIPYERKEMVGGDENRYNITDLQPYTSYHVELNACTSRGNGSYTSADVNTSQTDPENVRNISKVSFKNELSNEYKAIATVEFSKPCHTYGNTVSYTLKCDGKRDGYENDQISERSISNTSFNFNLQPENDYTCEIITNNNYGENSAPIENFISPPGVPGFTSDIHKIIPENKTPYQVIITLKDGYLNKTQGSIKYIAVILSTENISATLIDEWDNATWPSVDKMSKQISSNWWNPFQNSNQTSFTIGEGTDENPYLKDNTQYYLVLRIFTTSFYRDSSPIAFKTDTSKLGTILGVLFSLLFLVILGGIAFYIWKKGIHKKFPNIYRRKSSDKPISATAITVKKFINYSKNCENKPEILKQQFALLSTASDEIQEMNTSIFATLVENRRKNRYINISPFDSSRVKLMIDEDDEIGSDYINASYVKGYSGRVEYIATQGPLPSTNRDFWRMVLQENVTIIVMVANFVENNKQKCHKYFPQNHENLIVGDNMEIRCATELHFGTYIVRNLLVRKDCMQVTVTHMQFLEWPDFNIPTGTEHMLQFCYQLRERARLEGGVIIVHCSAGVGRTGTLIAADILLQTVNAGKQIDIYNTVLNLRKQRVKMVQTEQQYIYIHRLIADHIDRPRTPDSVDNADHIYENTDIIKKPKTNELKLDSEDESQF